VREFLSGCSVRSMSALFSAAPEASAAGGKKLKIDRMYRKKNFYVGTMYTLLYKYLLLLVQYPD
jgi:hypothetical protein